MPSHGMYIQITHLGMTDKTLLFNDVYPATAGPVYVSPGQTIVMVYTDTVSASFERGSIRGFVTQGFINAILRFGSDVDVPATSGWLSAEPFYVFVSTKADLPAPVAGVITLLDEVTYHFVTEVDLNGDRIVAGRDTVILGSSSENCRIKSTGLAAALITSQWSLPMRGITIEADLALDLDGAGNAPVALDWFGVNFTNCAVVGGIANYTNVILSDCAFLNSAGLVFDGTIDTVGLGTCLFSGRAGQTTISLLETATITRRFRIIYSSFVAFNGATALNVSAGATIPNEGYILDTVNFSGGATYLVGLQFNDVKSRFEGVRGVRNSASVAYLTMNGNAVATVIASAGVPVKAAGVTVLQSSTQRFTMPENNRLTYAGALQREFQVNAVVSFTGGANDRIGVYVARNGAILLESESFTTANAGGRVENVTCQTVVSLSPEDYIEIHVENDTDTHNITVTDMSTLVQALI